MRRADNRVLDSHGDLCLCISPVFLSPLLSMWADDDIQGAYWGTAYSGYALIYAPGYYVHTWNLRNKDMVRPLYVCYPLNGLFESQQLIQIYPIS